MGKKRLHKKKAKEDTKIKAKTNSSEVKTCEVFRVPSVSEICYRQSSHRVYYEHHTQANMKRAF